jgi:hypothetical protein
MIRPVLILILSYFGSVPLIQSRGGSIENTSVSQQRIYANHVKNTSISIVLFTARCIATDIIHLLPACSLLLEYVYRVVA